MRANQRSYRLPVSYRDSPFIAPRARAREGVYTENAVTKW